MLEATHISYKVKNKYLLRDVSLRLRAGEVVAVLGANGAGKSTLLKAIAGEIKPSEGSIYLNKKCIKNWKPIDLAKVRGVLSQSLQLAFPMPVLETVLLGRFAFQMQESAEQSRRVAHWALQEVQLQDFKRRNINTLSGGEQQRVHLARVMTQIYEPTFSQAKFLLLDEPVSNLDIAQQHNLLELVKKLTRKLQLGVLIVLHDMNLAAQYADQVIIMKHGHIIECGTPDKALVPETIHEAFGVESIVQTHPLYDCPQVITLQNTSNINLPNKIY